MVSSIHNNLPGEQEQHDHNFAERVKKGAENAVHCMGVNATDRVVILTDYKREGIARLVAAAAIAATPMSRYASLNTMESVH